MILGMTKSGGLCIRMLVQPVRAIIQGCNSKIIFGKGFTIYCKWDGLLTAQSKHWGRTNRTNQHSAPIYKLVQMNIPAQKRFIATIARRMSQLGAMTKGQRDTEAGVFSRG